MTKFKHKIIDIDDENGEIKVIGTKNIINTDGMTTLSDWAKDTRKKTLVDSVPLTNAIAVKISGDIHCDKIDKDAIGYFHNNANSVCHNAQYVNIFTSAFAAAHGMDIYDTNYTRCTMAFAARKLIETTWINQKDEYFAPNESHPDFHVFEMDSVIYALFHSASQQSSLRNVDYKNKKWDIVNQFFFMSRKNIMELADKYSYDECYNDARLADDRFVYKFIKEHRKEFSKEALAVLEKAEELLVKSFQMRKPWNDAHEEYQLSNWDCGFYQLKSMWEEFYKNDFKEFKSLYNTLGDKMRPMVYELGFLVK